MSTMHHVLSPGAAPFAIYEDAEDDGPLSPAMFDGDMSELSLSRDEPMPNIEIDHEQESEPEPYRSSFTARRPPSRTSGQTHYSFISTIPSETPAASKPVSAANGAAEPRYTPRKERPRFQNPEVRPSQLPSPPLLPAYESSRERVKASYKLATPSRPGRPETPASRRSASHRGSVRDHQSPRPQQAPQQAPLVLLHVTILPMQVPFSHDMMARVMPGWLAENYRLLEEKLQDIILMRRGLLIPHPRDEYELLEERILESLELKIPRLLKCGHFVPPTDDKDDDEDVHSFSDEGTGRGSRMSGGTMTEDHECKADATMCADCHRELKKPGRGVGAGTRKWDIKIYAANGLMRSEAWAAAWSEMERCDVEISPWVPEEVRKTLERKVQEEHEADKRKLLYAEEVQRRIQDDVAAKKRAEEEAAEKKRLDDIELQKTVAAAAAAALLKSAEEKAEDKRRYEKALEEKIEQAKQSLRLELEAQALTEAKSIAERLRAMEKALEEKTAFESSQRKNRPFHTDIPLGTLLENYTALVLRDPRNLVILLLSTLLLCMTMNLDLSQMFQFPSPPLNEDMLLGSVTPVMMTATATTTATATAFATVTYTKTATLSVAASSQAVVGDIKPTASAMLTGEEDLYTALAMFADEDDIVLTGNSSSPHFLDSQDDEAHTCPAQNVVHAPTLYCALLNVTHTPSLIVPEASRSPFHND